MISGLLTLIKFVIFLAAIPVLGATTIAFQREISTLHPVFQNDFLIGIGIYAFSSLFVYNFYTPYSFGKKIVSEMLKFLGPFVRLATFMIPIYSILTIALYFIFRVFLNVGPEGGFYFFMIGFTLSMHIILSAAELYEEDSNLVKMNYFFEMSLIYVAVMLLMGAIVDLSIPQFSFAHYFQILLDESKKYYIIIFQTLLKG